MRNDPLVSTATSAGTAITVRLLLVIALVYGLSSRAAVAQPALCLLYTSPSPRDLSTSRMPSSA